MKHTLCKATERNGMERNGTERRISYCVRVNGTHERDATQYLRRLLPDLLLLTHVAAAAYAVAACCLTLIASRCMADCGLLCVFTLFTVRMH